MEQVMEFERLAYMANQIATNLAAGGRDAAVRATADHIVAFWDPRMRAALLAGDPAELNEIARGAQALLKGGA